MDFQSDLWVWIRLKMEEWRGNWKAGVLACEVCLVRVKFREFGDLCLCRISSFAFLLGDGIREI